MKIEIISREMAQALIEGDFPSNTAVISFYDPPSKRFSDVLPPVDYASMAERVFYVLKLQGPQRHLRGHTLC